MNSTYQFKAIKSPCGSCDNQRSEVFPNCKDTCLALNQYLVSIGDIPHKPPEKIDLSTAYKAKAGNRWLMTDEAGVEQARDKLLEIKKTTGWTDKQICEAMGLSQGYVSGIIRGVQQRMSMNRWEKIMEWEAGR